MMPYINYHSARLQDPDKFNDDAWSYTEGGTIYGSTEVPKNIHIVWGKLKGHADKDDPPIPQALRFPKDEWTVTAAKKWLKDNKVKYIDFEEAKKSKEFQFHAKINKDKIIDSDDKTFIEGWASTQEIDRDVQVIDTEAIQKGINAFMENSILLYKHELPVGKVIEMKFAPPEEGGFWIKAFLSKAKDVESVLTKVKEGVLTALSIGFLPLKSVIINGIEHITELELWEVSIVPIGSNREALFSMAKGFKYGTDLIIPERSLEEEVERILNIKLAALGLDQAETRELNHKLVEIDNTETGKSTQSGRSYENLERVIKELDEEKYRTRFKGYAQYIDKS